MTNEAIVRLSGVTIRYGRSTAVESISFELQKGVTAVLGPNGAGKSSLLRVLATAQEPTSGNLEWFGGLPSVGLRRIRSQIGFVPQNPGFYLTFRVEEFLNHFAVLKDISSRATRRAEVEKALMVAGLRDRRRSRIKDLSGGMRQRLALGCAVLGDPRLLILDEPTVGLDPEQRAGFKETMTGLGKSAAVVLSTHQTDDLAVLAGRVLVMRAGRVVFDGTPSQLGALALGRVWISEARVPDAIASWTTASGSYRNVGTPPPNSIQVDPTVDDGYLVLTSLDRAGL